MIALLVGYPLVLFGTLFVLLGMYGLKGGPAQDTVVVIMAALCGVWATMIAVYFREKLEFEHWWLAGAIFFLWGLVDLMYTTAPYELPLPHTAIVGSLAWAAVAIVTKYRRSIALAVTAACTVVLISSALLLAAENSHLITDTFYGPPYEEAVFEPEIQNQPLPNKGVDIYFINPYETKSGPVNF